MNTVTIEGAELVITPRGMDKIWGLRREIRIPLAKVRGATVDPGVADEPRGVRAPGLAVPGKSVGRFVRDGEATYWNISDPRRTVVIEFDDEQYARAVLTVDSPEDVERDVNKALRAARKNGSVH